ncbi:hypothetical protein BaRGS_00027924 [Batillaria attramentaria]|uniref:Uncharacterized protein n=1 Tax=Batillaria attramentaria TaxID=370345 RepID=A0ABD0K1X0_9CAEN
MAVAGTKLSGPDIGVLLAYFVVIVLIGMFATWRSNRGTVSGYFLAGRSMWFLPIGASLFVSNIGTRHLMGLAGSGAASGISVGAWEFNAVLLLQMLGWIFVPVYISSGIYTMPEYLSKRFGGQRLRVYFAFLSLFLYVLTKCSGGLFAGALFLQQSLNWDLYVSIVILILVTALMTITGGLTAVIYTDTLQAILILAGATYLTITGFHEIGGFSGLLEKYPQAVPTNVSAIVVNTTCHWPDRNAFRMLRDVDDDYMPWLGFLLGQTPSSIWYWCNDQVLVQRALAAKSLSHAQGATLLAGFIKILPLFIMVMPGMISRVLYPDEIACTNPEYCYEVCQSRAGCSNIAYPRLVLGLLPDGARGLMMAVMIAALMSDLDSIFNSASTLFTMDIWRKFRKHASNTELMVVGRVFILLVVVLSIAWVPVVKETSGGEFYIYMARVTNYIAPPFAAIFLLGVFVPMVNETGAFWALMLALVTGLTRLVLTLVYTGHSYCGQASGQAPDILGKFHYMYFALFITVMTAVVAVLHKTTYWTRHDDLVPDDTDLDLETMENDRVRGQVSGKEDGDKENTNLEARNSEGATRVDVIDTHKHYERTNRCRDFFYNVFCGIHASSEEEEKNVSAMKKHLQDLAALKQSRTARVALDVGLVLILGLGVGMYVFWSVYRFPTGPFYPDGADLTLPGDDDLSVE